MRTNLLILRSLVFVLSGIIYAQTMGSAAMNLSDSQNRVKLKASEALKLEKNVFQGSFAPDFNLETTSVDETVCFLDDFSDIVNGHSNGSNGSNSSWNGNDDFPTVQKAYQAGGAVKLGTGSAIGFIESRDLTEVEGDITVNLMVKGWTNVEGDLIVSIDGQSETLSYTAVMADDFEMITASFEGVTAGSNLKIETSAKRAFIDNVEIICEEEAVVEGCLDAPYEQYPDAVYQPVCVGVDEIIVLDGWSGEYSLVALTSGVDYTFKSSITTDYITISNAEGTEVLAVGEGVVEFTASADMEVRFYTHVNDQCEMDLEIRARIVFCGEVVVIEEPDFECLKGNGLADTEIEDGYSITEESQFRVADKFVVDEGMEMEVHQITLDVLTLSNISNSTINLREDLSGTPGEIIETITIQPTEAIVHSLLFGYSIYHLVYDLDGSIVLGEGTYWIEPSLTNETNNGVYWALIPNSSTEANLFLSDDFGETWVEDDENFSAVFFVAGVCAEATEEPEPQDCSQGIPSFETVIDANGITIGEGYRVAEDFIVPAGTTFTMNQFTIDMNMSELPNDVIVYIHEDDGGYPGAIIETINTLHTSSEIVGSAFGDPIHHLIFELDTPIEFEEGTYWISPTMSVPSGDTAWWATTDQASDGFLPKYSNDEGDTWVDSTSGTHMIFTVSGICEGEGTTEPEDGCLWTVTVSDDDFGDEVEWELRDQTTGTVLLSGGGYGFGYSDVQTVTAEGPVEFYISTVGFFGDNTPSYSIENENGVIISGIAPGDTTQTFSDISCDDMPPPPPAYVCEDNFVASNNLENGLFFGVDSYQRLAVDVIVGDEGFTVYGMDLNIFTDGNTELDFYFTVYEDDGGLPGAVFNDNGYGQVISNEYLGEAFGFNVYNFVVKFDSSIDLEANTTYWIEVESTGMAWESTSEGVFGATAAYKHDGTGGVWSLATNDEMVYSLVCEQLGVSDLSSFDFAYYPNPVRDVLNIASQKAVQSVEVYNLTGQKVINESKVNQGQIDVSKLSAGTYVFRVTLEEGQVETFKIIKR